VWSFLLEAMVVSLSGVMAPGPISLVAVAKGARLPHAGALVAMGHGIVEFPLMVLIFLGMGYALDRPYVLAAISLFGGFFLLWMAVGVLRRLAKDETLRDTSKAEALAVDSTQSPAVSGVLLSLGNPYFLVWWATIGAALIFRSVQFGIVGFVLFALVHWSCDLLWDSLLSVLSFSGVRFFGRWFQKGAQTVCGAFLLFYGAKSILDALSLMAT
jgi:threonine/homoserine/homoserine lactone efflux protein